MLLASLGTLGPFSIDTYLPAFAGIASALGATPVQMQQTLSAYLLGFALMNLFHGALSDALGRRPVVLAGVAMFTLTSLGCALTDHIGWLIALRALQGMSTGAGMVVSRAVIRDVYPPEQAQKMMSQVTIFFGIAPAIAPMVGGWLFVHSDWRAVFFFLTLVGCAIWLGVWRSLPETLPPTRRQPLSVADLWRGYRELGRDRRFWLLALASGVPFNGMFLYVLGAPSFLGELMGLRPEQYFWFFLSTIAGIMVGAVASGRMAGRIAPRRQIRWGFVIMALACGLNVAGNLLLPLHPLWAFPPILLYSLGWAVLVPVVTLMVLDLAPARRGMASSLQATVGSLANALVAGVLTPLVMHSALALSLASAGLMLIGLLAWLWQGRLVRQSTLPEPRAARPGETVEVDAPLP
ncbi:multidrug effflux MFS transporter [Leptothrix discophora]|uniref:multidrug effflux MFS transporter n=1 Tax=Leptothrix discophora TaxID=89 RepID=UPI00387E2654